MVRLFVDEWLVERRPAPDLSGQLLCVWRGDLGEMRTPLPDECFDLVWVDDGSIWVCGPETRSWSRGYRPPTTAVGVRFRAGFGPVILRVAASELRDVRVRLDELWGDRDAGELADRVASQRDDCGRARVLEAAVRRLVVDAGPLDDVALAVAAGLNRRHPVSVRDLSRRLGLGERQVHRRCTAAFGYGPAVLTRILRLQRFLRLARTPRRLGGLADLASSAGYFDQQHLAHDVRAILATTPTMLVRASDPYKT